MAACLVTVAGLSVAALAVATPVNAAVGGAVYDVCALVAPTKVARIMGTREVVVASRAAPDLRVVARSGCSYQFRGGSVDMVLTESPAPIERMQLHKWPPIKSVAVRRGQVAVRQLFADGSAVLHVMCRSRQVTITLRPAGRYADRLDRLYRTIGPHFCVGLVARTVTPVQAQQPSRGSACRTRGLARILRDAPGSPKNAMSAGCLINVVVSDGFVFAVALPANSDPHEGLPQEAMRLARMRGDPEHVELYSLDATDNAPFTHAVVAHGHCPHGVVNAWVAVVRGSLEETRANALRIWRQLGCSWIRDA